MPLLFLRRLWPVALILFAAVAEAEPVPSWAFAVNSTSQPAPKAPDVRVHVPDSALSFTRKQLGNILGEVCDWHPDQHPAMPEIVLRGRPPKVFACAYCHLPNGAGRPENASLAGLPAAYIKRQVLAFAQGDRPGSEPKRAPQNAMIGLAQAATDADIDEAAAYFSALKPVSYIRVVETATVPKTVVAAWTLAAAPGGGEEAIGERIIEMPQSFERFENRDSRTPYIAYVPVGSIEAGAKRAAAVRGAVNACTSCHGPDLRGTGEIPALAGRSPSHIVRQLHDLRSGTRKGISTQPMAAVVQNLTDQDIIALAAYGASRSP